MFLSKSIWILIHTKKLKTICIKIKISDTFGTDGGFDGPSPGAIEENRSAPHESQKLSPFVF